MKERICDPGICEYCLCIGEGDSMCSLTNYFVLEDWVPTNSFQKDCPFLKSKGENQNG